MQANPVTTDPHMDTILKTGSIAEVGHSHNSTDIDRKGVKAYSEIRIEEQELQHDDLVETLWTDAAPDAQTQVSTLKYEDLWVLVRRFNKTVYHLKLADHIEGGLDSNIAGFETYSPEKLRGTVERFYIIVVVSLVAARKHVSRIRSWRETRRTLSFCSVYFAAWLLDILAPVVVGFIILFAASPTFRQKAFPHVPLAIVSVDGGPQQSAVGGVGSENTITGASEKIKGEALEAEASCVIGGITNIILNCLAGKIRSCYHEAKLGQRTDTRPDSSQFNGGCTRLDKGEYKGLRRRHSESAHRSARAHGGDAVGSYAHGHGHYLRYLRHLGEGRQSYASHCPIYRG